jgi:hypothetical protein
MCISILLILLSTRVPNYLSDRLQPARSTRTLNIIMPFYRTSHSPSSFFAQGADRWNNVPSFIKRKPSLPALREAYLSIYPISYIHFFKLWRLKEGFKKRNETEKKSETERNEKTIITSRNEKKRNEIFKKRIDITFLKRYFQPFFYCLRRFQKKTALYSL